MNYKNLVFTALMAVSFMSHAAEPKTQISSRSNPLFAWFLGTLTLKTAYHGLSYGRDSMTLDSIKQGYLTLGSPGSWQASVAWQGDNKTYSP